MPYSSYIKYYEQALVLTLEHIILGIILAAGV